MKITITNTQTITIEEDDPVQVLKKIFQDAPIELQQALKEAANRNNLRRLITEIFKKH